MAKQRLSKHFPVLAKVSVWFYGLPQRDQLALKCLLVAVLIFFIYFAVWQPSQNYLERSQAEVEQAYADLIWMKENQLRARQMARQFQTNGPQNELSGKSLLSVVSSSAEKFKVDLQRFEPRGDNRVNVWLDEVSFNQMMLWIADLDARYGVRVEQIAVDKADLPGNVAARMSFQI